MLRSRRASRSAPTASPRRSTATAGGPFTIVVDRGTAHAATIGPLRARNEAGVYLVGFEIKAVNGPGESLPASVWSALGA